MTQVITMLTNRSNTRAIEQCINEGGIFEVSTVRQVSIWCKTSSILYVILGYSTSLTACVSAVDIGKDRQGRILDEICTSFYSNFDLGAYVCLRSERL
ncbi:uncharacterized protein YALI1_F32816g [Yarrowia lipolytica]|uniref:Uncharacterized protein n=1 Tax=Yarrowia lipolytica TaxID=4952 RepID=A0A1D8NPY8_YARLL|nr:hypothetical protein YALI1_F32816g [Yarrowia lipolytica]